MKQSELNRWKRIVDTAAFKLARWKLGLISDEEAEEVLNHLQESLEAI